jgi:U3 small nucleolar RNA-associated protein 10
VFISKHSLFQLETDHPFEPKIHGGVLDVLSNRLHNITDTVRRAVSPAIITILDFVRRTISSTSTETLMISSLKALRTISLTIRPGEEGSLANAIPSVLVAMQRRNALATATNTLAKMV